MVKTKTREITIIESGGSFNVFKKSEPTPKDNYDFAGIAALRNILSNEKARILHVLKTEKPTSIYNLAKKLNRTFKSTYTDLKLLERFGFIEFIEEKTKKRIRHRPVISVDKIIINIKI